MKALHRIAEALQDAPMTLDDIAAVTGIPADSCRAHVSELSRSGIVLRDRLVVREVVQRRRVPLYRLSTQQSAGEQG